MELRVHFASLLSYILIVLMFMLPTMERLMLSLVKCRKTKTHALMLFYDYDLGW